MFVLIGAELMENGNNIENEIRSSFVSFGRNVQRLKPLSWSNVWKS